LAGNWIGTNDVRTKIQVRKKVSLETIDRPGNMRGVIFHQFDPMESLRRNAQ